MSSIHTMPGRELTTMERLRISRDLHDSLAHSLTAILPLPSSKGWLASNWKCANAITGK